MARTYPINLLLSGRRCVVVGGGEVAARKVHSLLDAGAHVRVVAPEFCADLLAIQGRSDIELVTKAFEPRDVRGALIVIAATDDQEVNAAARQAAAMEGCLVNVVDEPDLCDFYVPSTVRRGDLMLTVSTGGSAPALSKKIRRQVEGIFGPEYETYIEIVAACRERARERHPDDPRARAEAMERVLGLDLLAMIRGGEVDRARREALACI